MKFRRSNFVAIHDIVMAAFSFLLAIYIRVGDVNFFASMPIFQDCLIIAVISGIVFGSLRLYRGIWRYASVQDLIAITKGVTITIVLSLIMMFLANRLEAVPRSAFIIHWMLLLMLLGAPRFAYRALNERRLNLCFNQNNQNKIPILLLGINNNTELFLREYSRATDSSYEVVGIIDEDSHKQNSYIMGIKILGSYLELSEIYNNLKQKNKAPQKLIITSEHLDGQIVRDLLSITDLLAMSLARLPRLTEFKDTSPESKLEIAPIVIQDLLGRAQNTLSRTNIESLIAGKIVMITGSGGTIGSELTRQIADFKPAKLILLELSEFLLYSIDQELAENFPEIMRKSLIADVRDARQIDKIFAMEVPDIVFHAAALKHVPIAENNLCEAVITNIIGTKNVADACLKYKAGKMVMISTDKAVNPLSVMGATKRAAENYIQSLGQHHHSKHTSFVTVRFGNVLGSSGSVIPLFEKQLKNGGPITITHPDMVRYFMTVREAVELVLHASATDNQGGNNSVFVLDMGQPVKIKDLAIQMIKMAGLRPEIDIKLQYTGIREGEKLYEELFYQSEFPLTKLNDSLMLATQQAVDYEKVNKLIDEISIESLNRNSAKTFELLCKLVKEYTPNQNSTTATQ